MQRDIKLIDGEKAPQHVLYMSAELIIIRPSRLRLDPELLFDFTRGKTFNCEVSQSSTSVGAA